VGDALTRMKEGAKAVDVLQSVQEPCERMVREHPRVVQYQKELATGQLRLAEALRQVGKPDDAALVIQKAIDLNEKMLKENPNDPDNRESSLQLLAFQGDLALDRKRPAEAMKFYRNLVKARDVKERTVDQHYDLACARAKLAAGGSVSGSGMSAAEVKAEADKAMAALNHAVAAGYHDVDNMRKDPDLEGVRNREDFKQLIARLQQPKKPAEKKPAEKKPAEAPATPAH
jgi:tetratricopeptide (TPR) repeat protein